MKFLRLLAERIRLLFRGTRRERQAIERWKGEHRRVRDALHRFVGHGLEPGLGRVFGYQDAEGTVVVVGISGTVLICPVDAGDVARIVTSVRLHIPKE